MELSSLGLMSIRKRRQSVETMPATAAPKCYSPTTLELKLARRESQADGVGAKILTEISATSMHRCGFMMMMWHRELNIFAHGAASYADA